MPTDLILEMKGVSKRFGGLKALDRVDFTLHPGEVHALIGENGAGKSTLMKVLGGVHRRDEGTIVYKGGEVDFADPNESMDAGISIIYQELSALPSLSVTENLFMGRMPTRLGVIDWKYLKHESRKALAQVGLTGIHPQTQMKSLSIAQRQLIEIAKAMTRDAAIVVMDEPNSSLSPGESERMFEMIDKLKSQGTALVYVSHKLDEVLRVADRITVFRDGGLVGTIDKEGADEDKLIQMMVGRELQREYVPRRCGDKTLLEVKNISGRGFDNVSFDLKQGEILCFSGLMGAGRSEVMKAFMGADSWHGGEVVFDGKPVCFKNPKQALEAGVVMLQEDRKRLSLFMNLPIKFNMEIGVLPMVQSYGIVNGNKAGASTRSYVKSLDIKLASLGHPVKSLSGGNQQKTILARWLAVKPRILILDEPTHGVDVGAKSEIYRLIRELADEGMSIILISSELPEVLAMADRVVVMCEGAVTGILPRDKGLDEETIMRFAAGSAAEAQSRAG